jgi:BNR repeat-like domain
MTITTLTGRTLFRLLPVAILLGALGALPAAGNPAPFAVVPGLLARDQPETLGLDFAPGAETFTIFRPGPDDDWFAHGVVLMPFRGRLYAQWQSSAKDEDSDDTHVVYSVSDDGELWSPPAPLAATLDDGIRTSGGWWTDGETLVAFVNEWPRNGGGLPGGRAMYRTSSDGTNWSELRPVTNAQGAAMRGVIEQDPHALPDGRIVTAFHMQPGLIVSPWFTDDPLAVTGWRQGRMRNLAYTKPTSSRAIEPGWYQRQDGAIVMVFRDQSASFYKLGAVSHDRGETWSTPVLTNVPDSRSKQSAGNLPDGTAYIVSNPTPGRRRIPLVILLSADGEHFDRAWLLRGGGNNLQAQRYEGRYKRAGFSYPKSVLWDDMLYVGYATNKEDVEYTRIPLRSLELRRRLD